MPLLKDLVVRFRADITAVDNGIQTLNAKLDANNKALQSKYGALSSGLQQMGTAMTLGVTVPFVLFAKNSIDTYARLDALKKGLVAVTGSSSEAARQLKDLKEVARLPGLGFEEAVRGATQLQAAGMKANEAKQAMLQFGNAIAQIGGGKTELGAVMQQLMQMRSNGKVMTEDLRIIKNYAPQISKAMEAAYGTSNAEQIQKKGIGSQEFINRMSQELSRLPRVTGGLKNDLENLDDAFNTLKANVVQAVAGTVSGLINKVSAAVTWFNNLGTAGKRMIVGIAAGLAGLGPVLLILSKLPSICSGASLAIKGLGIAWKWLSATFIASETTNPVGWILLAITAVIGLIALIVKYRNQLGLTDGVLKQVKTTVMGAFRTAWEAVKPAITAVWNLIKQVYDACAPIRKFVQGLIIQNWKMQFEALVLVLKAVAWAVTKVAEAFKPVIDNVTEAINKLTEFLHLKTQATTSGGMSLLELNVKTAITAIKASIQYMYEFKKRQQEATQTAITNAKARMDAIKQEMQAEREKWLGMAGFSSLRSMWQKQMEVGTKERLTPESRKPSNQEYNELVKHTKMLEENNKFLKQQVAEWQKTISYAKAR